MLFRKMLRDIKNNKMQFISIMFMAFLAIFVYSGIGSEWYTFQKITDEYYEEQNLADIWLYGNDFKEDDVNSLLNVNGITDAVRRIHLTGTGKLESDPELLITLGDTTNISTCKILSGKSFDPSLDGIWLSEKFADSRNLCVGDTLEMEVQGHTITKQILGIMNNPEYVYACASFDSLAVPENIGIVYAGMDFLPKSVPQMYNEIAATSDIKDYDLLEQRIERQLGDKYHVFISRNSQQSYQQFYNEILQNKAMGDIFPFVFIFVALLTILTTMTRIVNSQRIQIGTLKSLGFRDSKIKWHYISYGVLSSSIGAVLGLVLGPILLAPLFFKMQSGMYLLPSFTTRLLPNAVLITAVTILACALIIYVSCRKILKEIPAESLRPSTPKMAKRMWMEKTSLWQKAGFDFQWNFRDALRNKIRSLMAIIGIMGCMALLTCGLGLLDSLNHINHWKYDILTDYKNKIQLTNTLTVSDITYPGESIQEGSVEVRTEDQKKATGLTVPERDSTLTAFTDNTLHKIQLPEDGISVSYKISQSLSLSVGDTLEWHLYGDSNWISSKVKAIYRDPVAQGIVVFEDYFQKEGFTYQPTSYLTKEEVNASDNNYTVWNAEGLKSSILDMMESMYTIVYIMIFVAIIMAVVVLYNLGILSFTEKQREFATLRVLGFKSGKIRKLLFTQNICLSILGLLPGYFLGKTVIYIMCQLLGEDFDMMTIISIPSILISISITLLTSFTVNILFSRKVKSIDMVSALKGAE